MLMGVLNKFLGTVKGFGAFLTSEPRRTKGPGDDRILLHPLLTTVHKPNV